MLDDVSRDAIAALKPSKDRDYSIRREDFETEFGVRVLVPTKRRRFFLRRWYIRYYVDGRGSERRRLFLGNCSRVPFEKAVSQAYVAWDRIARGEDPQAKAAKSKRKGIAFGDACSQYIQHIRPTKVQWRRDQRALDKCPKSWSDRSLASIKREEIHAHLATVLDRGDEAARQTRSIISTFFGWAVDKDFIKTHPAERIRLPLGKASYKLGRAFTDREVGILYRDLSVMAEDDSKALILLLTLLLGQRGGESRQMAWNQFDYLPEIPGQDAFGNIADSFGCAWWDMPGRDPKRGIKGITKNGHPHRVCLVPEVVELLERRAGMARKDSTGHPVGPVFPGRDPDRSITQRAIYKLTDKLKVRYQWKPWDPTRTFRSTFVSTLHRWGVRRYVQRALINHVYHGREGVTEGYNYWMYPAERCVLMRRYYDHVVACAAAL